MANNLEPVARQAVLNALRGAVVQAKLYGRYQYVVPGESPVVVEYLSDAKPISFTVATTGATTSISMVQTDIDFDINLGGFNENEEIVINGVLLTADDASGTTPDTIYLSAPFGQTFTYESQGLFTLTSFNIFST